MFVKRTGIEPVPTASETIVLSIGLRAQFSHGVDGDCSSISNDLASIVFLMKIFLLRADESAVSSGHEEDHRIVDSDC